MYSIGSRLNRVIRHLMIALLAVFAFGAVTAAAAQAEEAPFWSVKGARLGAGETRWIKAKATESFTLSASGIEVTCKSLKLKEGASSALLGSAIGEPGTNDEVIEFSECTVTGNGTGCKVEEPIVTKPVKSELVYNTGKKKVLTEFFPAKGASFVKLNFPTASCRIKETIVEGSVVGEVFTDTTPPKAVELPNSPGSAKSWLIKFPKPAITEVCLKKVGATECSDVVIGLTAFTAEATLTGTALIELVSGEEWSPLP
jgi:hypothetical protein